MTTIHEASNQIRYLAYAASQESDESMELETANVEEKRKRGSGETSGKRLKLLDNRWSVSPDLCQMNNRTAEHVIRLVEKYPTLFEMPFVLNDLTVLKGRIKLERASDALEKKWKLIGKLIDHPLIEVNGNDGSEFFCNTALMSCKTDFVNSMMKSEIPIKGEPKVLLDHSEEVINQAINYLATGDSQCIPFDNIFSFLDLADFLQSKELKACCFDQLTSFFNSAKIDCDQDFANLKTLLSANREDLTSSVKGFLSKRVSNHFLSEIQKFEFAWACHSVTTEGINCLSKSGSLTHLNFSGLRLTNGIFENLGKMRLLKCLNLMDCKGINNGGLEKLVSSKTITTLFLNGSWISNETCKFVGSMTRLTELGMEEGSFDDTGVQSLSTLKSLKKLWLDGTNITDASCKILGQMELTSLSLNGCIRITNNGMMHLKGLKEITLSNTHINKWMKSWLKAQGVKIVSIFSSDSF